MTETKRRGRLPKVRLEGEAATMHGSECHPDPVPGDNGEALRRISSYFITEFPEEWEAMRLCPLQHGLEAMADKLTNG